MKLIKNAYYGYKYKSWTAKETLAKFAPKLAICTYRYPEDPKILADIILKTNPTYKIVQRKMKLFAVGHPII